MECGIMKEKPSANLEKAYFSLKKINRRTKETTAPKMTGKDNP